VVMVVSERKVLFPYLRYFPCVNRGLALAKTDSGQT
jgi:hypothetical protein